MKDGSPSGNLSLRRGDRQLNGSLLDGALDGPLRIDSDGRPLANLSYRQGLLHGPLLMLHGNGQASARLNYVNDKLQGPATFYTEQGGLLRQAHYRDGLLHGEVRTYFPDGCLAEIEQYQAGQLHGLHQRFHGNGRPSLRGSYREGLALGPAQGFAADGRPVQDCELGGFFQLFHATDPALTVRPLFGSWHNASGYDSAFLERWPESHRTILPLTVTHLGRTGIHWCGRDNRAGMGAMQAERREQGGWRHERLR